MAGSARWRRGGAHPEVSSAFRRTRMVAKASRAWFRQPFASDFPATLARSAGCIRKAGFSTAYANFLRLWQERQPFVLVVDPREAEWRRARESERGKRPGRLRFRSVLTATTAKNLQKVSKNVHFDSDEGFRKSSVGELAQSCMVLAKGADLLRWRWMSVSRVPKTS